MEYSNFKYVTRESQPTYQRPHVSWPITLNNEAVCAVHVRKSDVIHGYVGTPFPLLLYSPSTPPLFDLLLFVYYILFYSSYFFSFFSSSSSSSSPSSYSSTPLPCTPQNCGHPSFHYCCPKSRPSSRHSGCKCSKCSTEKT